MRHSFRSWLDGVGTNVTIQQKAMRHSNIGITMKYGDSDRGAIAQAQEKVSALVPAPEGMARERVPF